MNVANSNADMQRIPWKVRPDLKTVALEFEGRPTRGVKDPLNLAYFELSEEAFFVLNQLDGQRGLEEICRSFHDRFRPRLLSTDECRDFLRRLIAQNLVVAEASGSGLAMAARRNSIRSRSLWPLLFNVLAIRFRGFDPDRLLTRLVPWLGWIFSPAAIGIGIALIGFALTLVVVHFDELRARLPEAQILLSVSNLASISLLLAVVKVLHEFGHGLACKRFGGECHEMGVMLLVFTPTLYCNVSDVWMLKDKWQRIMVGVAGIWIEAVIAGACTLLWWFSAPGLFHSICLNLMFLCGVNTFIFNGNPLLRYDGYFVLSDWLEIPNLQQQAATTVRAWSLRWFCGINTDGADGLLSHRQWGLFVYGIAASIYRLMLTVLILWGLHRWLNPLGLGALIQVFAAFTLGSMVVLPMSKTARFLKVPANRSSIQWAQLWWRGGATLLGLIVLLSIPLPSRVTAFSIADDTEAEQVYVTFPGTLIESARIGQTVDSGHVIARLDDPRLKVVLTQMLGELTQQRSRLEQLERRRVNEPHLAAILPTLRETVRNLEEQLRQCQEDAERLTVRSRRAGTVIAESRLRRTTRSGSLAGWTGSPLEEKNWGSFLRAGTILCSVGSDHCQSAVVLINQDDIVHVHVGQRVRFLWNELSGEIQYGEIVALSEFDLDSLPNESLIRLNLPTRVSSQGVLRPVGKWYQGRVKLEPAMTPLLHGATGTAKIFVKPQSFLRSAIRWLQRTFPLQGIAKTSVLTTPA